MPPKQDISHAWRESALVRDIIDKIKEMAMEEPTPAMIRALLDLCLQYQDLTRADAEVPPSPLADPDADVAELHASIDREVAADMSAAEQPLGEM